MIGSNWEATRIFLNNLECTNIQELKSLSVNQISLFSAANRGEQVSKTVSA